jgi:hypothetical protein
MKVKNGFSNGETFIINEISKNISSVNINDDEAIANIVNNKEISEKLKNIEFMNIFITNLRKKESQRRKIIVVLTSISLALIIFSLFFGFITKRDYTLIVIIAGSISLVASIISTIISEKMNKKIYEQIDLKRTV